MVKNGKLSDTYTTTVGDDDQIEASGLLGELVRRLYVSCECDDC